MISLSLVIEELEGGLVFTRMSAVANGETEQELLKGEMLRDLIKEHLLKTLDPKTRVTLVQGSQELSDGLLAIARRLSLKRQQDAKGGD